jgi:hypothetical protein
LEAEIRYSQQFGWKHKFFRPQLEPNGFIQQEDALEWLRKWLRAYKLDSKG